MRRRRDGPTTTARVLVRAAALVVFAAVASAGALRAAASGADEDFHDCAAKDGVGDGECQHFLRIPVGVTDDPCWCDKCRNGVTGQKHDGHTIPPGWNAQLFETGGMDVYLKRHGVMWGITCSACFSSENVPWPDGTGPKNTGTPPAKDWAGRPAKETIAARVARDSRFFKKPDAVVVAYNRHFYVVTDVEPLKHRLPSGTSRVVTRHEWAHWMIERSEFARREWVRNLGAPLPETQPAWTTNRIPVLPMLLVYAEKQRDYEKISAEYFRGAASKGLRGSIAHIVDGMCLTGLGMSREKFLDEKNMLVATRHQMAHNLLSIWGSWETRPKSTPEWMDEGLAHWLSKSIAQTRQEAHWCTGEGQAQTGAGAPSYNPKNWDVDVAKWAAAPGRLGPIEALLAKTTVMEMSEEDQKRSWSYCALGLDEWREPFVKMLAALRQEKDVREAFMSALGMPPEAFDERWRERVAGKRRSLGPVNGEPSPGEDDTPGARDRRSIRGETDARVLAAKVYQLGEIADARTIPVVVDVIGQDRDLPRETAFVALLRTKDPRCVEALWTYGLAHADPVVRAYTARLCGRLDVTAALEPLRAQIEDRNWLARAEAAVACGALRDAKAMAAMRKMAASDPSERAQVAAMDALALFGEGGAAAAPVLAKALKSSQWQIRIAACQALGEIGQMESVEPLVARMEEESGRVADEIRAALKKITRDDLGRDAANWRRWWDREKAANPGVLPKRPAAPDPKKAKEPDPNDPRATHDGIPAYFGLEIYSSRVGFVVDTSESMLDLFTPDPSAAAALSRTYEGTNKLAIAKQEVEQALRGLDPRAHFNLISFGTEVRPFQRNPVPASRANVDDALSFLGRLPGEGETNYYDALKAVLDVGERPDTNENFRSTPDTITFLTDGEPTRGDITGADVILEWYTGLNRYARVRTHTITFGLVNVDMPLLRAMAERNGGRFTLVPETRKR